MKLHRFISDFDLSERRLILTGGELVHQIKDVLHLQIGEKIILNNGALQEAVASIVDLKKNSLELAIETVYPVDTEPDCNVTLYCAILKKENFEWVVQKSVEMGVINIVPLQTDRTVKLNLPMQRLEKIIKESAEQSGRGVLPTLRTSTSLQEVLQQKKTDAARIFFTLNAPQFVAQDIKKSKNIDIFIGPEGGWSEREIELARGSGCILAQLSPLTLRAETAAVVAAFAVIYGKNF